MVSKYNEILKLLINAFDYPDKLCKFQRSQIEFLVQKFEQNSKEEFLKFFNEHLKERKEYVRSESELYYVEVKDIVNQFKTVETYIDSLETYIVENQNRERFFRQPGDKFTVRIIKIFKRFIQNFLWLIPKIKNIVQRIKKKEKQTLQFKKHKIKKQQLAKLVFINYFFRDTKHLFDFIFDSRLDLLIRLKEIENNIYKDLLINNINGINDSIRAFEEVDNLIEKHKNETKQSLENVENSLNHIFDELCHKIGTFEFPSKNVNQKKINSQRHRYNITFEKIIDSYQLRYSTLESHWNYKFEIYKVFCETSKEFNSAAQITEDSICQKIEKPFMFIVDELANWLKDHSDKKSYNTEILSGKLLGEHLLKFTDSILLFNIIPVLEDLKNKAGIYFNSVNSQILVPKRANYHKALKKRNIKQINVLDLTKPLYTKLIHSRITEASDSLVGFSQKVLQSVNEADKIIEYSIEFYKTSTEKEKEENNSEFYGSIKRAQEKITETYKLIQDKRIDSRPQLIAVSNNYIESLNAAVDPKEIIKNIRKAKIKNQRDRFKNYLKKLFVQLLSFSKLLLIKLINSINFIRKNYTNLRVLFGISKPSESISNELSDYLSETENAINNLPIMYQRLFKSEPLKTGKMYIPRTKIDEELKMAFSAWVKNKFAPTFIISEVGNGITTLINFLEKDLYEDYSVSRFNITYQITEEGPFLDFLYKVFSDLDFKSLNELENILNESQTKRIIILENIHYFFGRYNDGFTNIKMFLEFVSKTNKNVYWLCSVNLYAWKYLNYAITISDYFAYVIHVEGLSKDEMIRTIYDRHLPSGYNIHFLKRDSVKISKKFKKMNEQQKQDFLKNDFFNVFYKLSQGNIKLTLLFWQMSVNKIKDSTFYLKIKEIDHSFLESLGMQKLLSLHNILIHGGLNLKEHSKIFGISESSSLSQLIILENDAIIMKYNEQYHINPLIYRQVVNHLKAIILIY